MLEKERGRRRATMGVRREAGREATGELGVGVAGEGWEVAERPPARSLAGGW